MKQKMQGSASRKDGRLCVSQNNSRSAGRASSLELIMRCLDDDLPKPVIALGILTLRFLLSKFDEHTDNCYVRLVV